MNDAYMVSEDRPIPVDILSELLQLPQMQLDSTHITQTKTDGLLQSVRLNLIV